MGYYCENAKSLFEQYSSVKSADVHSNWLEHLPKEPGLACDIGAGSGRDANWLAEKGWDVVAVEPSKKLRELGQANSHPNVTWLDDCLPDLEILRDLNYRFNLIILSAVWMHVAPKQRERVFRILSRLLAPGGILFVSLRHGVDETENKKRGFHPVNLEELRRFAANRALVILVDGQSKDLFERQHVNWQTIVFQLPEDGTSSLPLLRHIIVNDEKSATYKLGLLRILARIAEGASGAVIERNEHSVIIPFGLVGLYWVKQYMSLVLQHALKQTPGHDPTSTSGLGFAKKNHFYLLSDSSPYDLRVAAKFSHENAQLVIRSIGDACQHIKQMPANYITYPGSSKHVFDCEYKSVRVTTDHWQITNESLASFGTFSIPSEMWQTLGQYACWLEPAIIKEWCRLMVAYKDENGHDIFTRALEWDEGKRDTSLARERVAELQTQGYSLTCVWSEKRLRGINFEIDHCLPWSRWGNNDLWNLMPTNGNVNNKKKEKLPSAKTLQASKKRILKWWKAAYVDSQLNEQFFIEAETAFPMVKKGTKNLETIFDGLIHQRNRLKYDQQLLEWSYH